MKVIDKVKVLGRGYILVIIPDDEINITDMILFDNIRFKICGIERLSNMKQIGLVLSPNDMVGKLIDIDDEITLLKNEDKI